MKPTRLLQLAFVCVAAVAVYGFVTVAQDAEARRACVPICAMRPSYAARDRTAPDFELEGLRGRRVRLSAYRGKTVVLNFWTSTCKPCLEEMPSIAELAKVLAPRKDVVVLTVSTDESRDSVLATLRALVPGEPPFEVLLDPESSVVGGKFGTRLFPETWIVDRHGVVRARFDGARDWSNAMVLDLVESLERPGGCAVEFRAGTPSGPAAGYCEEAGG